MIDITAQVQDLVAQADIQKGLCFVMHGHSTAGLILNSVADPPTLLDLETEIDRLVPTRIDFHHTYDTPVTRQRT